MTANHRVPWRTRSATLLSLIAVVSLLYSTFPVPEPTEAAESLPTSMVGNGTYYVYATREGLVGGMTSSGHRIVENDFFVALPSCVPQNCPRGALRGNMTNCGTRCYVRVLNPVTNQCRVEPVKDLGPWFTVDDWWNPTSSRYLNSLATNPQVLPQGYTGADAARDGRNVGYGISAGGIGHDNTGPLINRPYRPVGNRAAIDLADGTWRNLRLTSPDSIGSRVFVTMFWQSGGDPASEAQKCGHQLYQRGGTMYTLPTQPTTEYPYPPATSTVVVTPVAQSTAVVVGTGGVGLRCRTGPSTGASVITTLPEGATVAVRGLPISGWQPLICNGKEGWASTSYLRVTYATPTPTVEPTATPTLEPTSTDVPGTPGTPGTPESSPGTPGTPDSTPGTPDGSPATSETPGSTPGTPGTPPSTPVTPTATPPTPTPASTTVTPSPSPTLIPTTTPPAQTGRAVVTGTGGAGLRCRNAPSTAGAKISTLAEGATVTLRGASQAGWYPVLCSGQNGWASASYLRVTIAPGTPVASPTPATPSPTATAPATPVPSTQTGVVANSGGSNVNCRTQATTNSAIITSLREGTQVQIRGATLGDWVPIRCANRDGFMHRSYVRISSSRMSIQSATEETAETNVTPSPGSDATQEPTNTVPVATDVPTEIPTITDEAETPILVTHSGYIASDDGQAINCRATPSTEGGVITVLEHGTWLELRGDPVDGWQGVRCGGVDGFVSASFISLTEPAPIALATEPPPDVPEDEPVDAVAPAAPPSAQQGSNPQFGGAPVAVSSIWDEGSSSPWNAVDGSSDSAWAPPGGVGQARLTIDLGSPVSLTGVRWMFGSSGSTGELQVYTSMDGETWSWAGSAGARQPFTWEGIWASGTARYVRLISVDTAGAGFLASIAEVQVWGTPALERLHMARSFQQLPSRVAHWRGIGGTIATGNRRSVSLR